MLIELSKKWISEDGVCVMQLETQSTGNDNLLLPLVGYPVSEAWCSWDPKKG